MLLENQAIFQNIRTVRNFDPELPRVLVDAGELQQVIVNIVINAADAMEENGTLTIETGKALPTQEILIRISDTGKGIPDDDAPFHFRTFFYHQKSREGDRTGVFNRARHRDARRRQDRGRNLIPGNNLHDPAPDCGRGGED